MRLAVRCVRPGLTLLAVLLAAAPLRAEPPAALAARAQAILKANCHRCHGRDGALEGGFNYVLDRDKLVARQKVVPGKPDESLLFKRVAAGKMPPEGEEPRPGKDDVAVLRQWIEAGAPAAQPAAARAVVTESTVFAWILTD